MQYYECVGIIPGNLAENEVTPVFEAIIKHFTDASADIKRKEIIGRRKMAYAINNMRHGYYFLIGAEFDGEKLHELERKLKLDNNVMRFLITKHKPKTEEEIKKEQDRLARQASQIGEKTDNNEQETPRKRTATKTNKKTTEEKVETTQTQEKPKKDEPVDVDQLEKKLDEILDEEIK